ncbi:ABC transporter ATP-binding protein [Acuticoccus kandeliae]|uniref:ABC transporter ATP-binding protein n=1 Tax=Acuticoccus kandeliae TaxID=2073160 RepID=UPI000D3E6A92|nr:ABC transporter ATP-binding protein [Acuticoccus kandeliae]
MSHLAVSDLTKTFPVRGRMETVLHGVSLDVVEGEFVSLLGPSGCGKTTTLRCIAGLERPTSGAIRIGGVDRTRTMPQERNIGMCFQDATVYPHMRIRENLAYPLKLQRVAPTERAARVEAMAESLRITALLDKYPAQASGGQRQRVALGRALIRKPDLFLLDEPMSSLDAKLKIELRKELKLLTNALRTTTVFVTHDQEEAMAVSDRICVMNGGRIEQFDTPSTIYLRPATVFVAGFVGMPAMNLFACVSAGGGLVCEGQRLAGAPAGRTAGERITLGVRPEDVLLGDGPGVLDGTVALVERLGERTIVYLTTAVGEVRASMRGECPYATGDSVPVNFSVAALHHFDAAGLRLPAA